MPRFSVVVPTRDRPDLLHFCLQALAAQTLADVEVIVVDNPISAPAREVFDRWATDGWRYVRADRPLAMHDNFEFGCDAASGDYVAVVIDKTALHPTAFEFAHHALLHQRADIVTWRNEGYDPLDEAGDPLEGRYSPAATTTPPALYDPSAELARRLANSTPRGIDHVHYVRGKIVFGAFSRALLERMRTQTGRVFHALGPDYTSMAAGCVLADQGLDLGRPLLVSYNSIRSTGRAQSTDPTRARQFIEAIDPTLIDALPIAGLYASLHNVVAYDLTSSVARCPAGSTPPLDVDNLLRRAREDLDGVAWSDPVEREAQYAILKAAEQRRHVAPQAPVRRTLRRWVGDGLAHVAPLERMALWAAGYRTRTPAVFSSPFEAARAADRHYSDRSGP